MKQSSFKPLGLVEGVVASFRILTPSERRYAIILTASMIFNAMLGMIGLAAVLPFVQLMLDADPLSGGRLIASSIRSLGVQSADQAILLAGFALVLLILLKNLYGFVHVGLQNHFCAGCETRVTSDLLERVARAPYLWLAQRNSSRLRDAVLGSTIEWSRAVIRPVLQLLNDTLFIALALGLVVWASPRSGIIVAIISAILTAAVFRYTRPRIFNYAERKRQAIRSAGVIATEMIVGGRDIRVSNVADQMTASFKHDIAEYARCDGRSRQWQSAPRLVIEVISVMALVGVALGALWNGMPRADVAALLALYAVVAVRAVPVMSQMVSALNNVTDALPAVAELEELRQQLAPMQDEVVKPHALTWNTISLEDVEFAYPQSQGNSLGPISLMLERGSSCGIIGLSGAGKSTLVDVIAGLLPPSSGRLLLDGNPLDDDALVAWRHRIAYVAQNPFLIDGTLRDNVKFGQADDADSVSRLQWAIDASGLSAFVATLPEQIDTRIGERGMRLSGGQRQRIAIARALYRQADLLVLDEATSALDSLTEREVSEAIEALRGRVTVVVVAHRLASVARLDKIVLMDQGRKLGEGRHEDLLAASPVYRRMVDAQSVAAFGATPTLDRAS